MLCNIAYTGTSVIYFTDKMQNIISGYIVWYSALYMFIVQVYQ